MEVRFSKKFHKQYKKLQPAIQSRFTARLALWSREPTHPQLHRHALTGKLAGLYSINVGGDIRAIYRIANESVVVFEKIGTHSQLYG